MFRTRHIFLAVIMALAGCGSNGAVASSAPDASPEGTTNETDDGPADVTPEGDGGPAGSRAVITELDPPSGATVYAISDIHGGYDRVAGLLAKNGILAGFPGTPPTPQWAAGNAILVVAGDLIDKGPQPIEVIDFLRALETSATKSGGQVIVLLGNHEAEFFVDPTNGKASAKDGIDAELSTQSIAPASIATGADPRGGWLREKALGVRVGGWFFSHAGNTKGRTIAALSSALSTALAAHPDYSDPEIVGTDSILEARDWYTAPAVANANAKALGVGHIVFGHDPSALGAKGAIASAQDGLLFRIDCGMSPDVNDSTGCILRITRPDAATEVAEALDAKGKKVEVWRGPPVR